MSGPSGATSAGPRLYRRMKVLVTGGGTGIGRATAILLPVRGARARVTTGRREQPLRAASNEISATASGAIQPFAADFTVDGDRARLFSRVRGELGGLDALVANKGGGGFSPFGTYAEVTFYERFDINVKAVALTAQRSAELMPSESWTAIVGSMAGRSGLAGLGLHAASKAAVRSFARTWSNDLKDRHIRDNVVSPDHGDTDAQQGAGIPVTTSCP